MIGHEPQTPITGTAAGVPYVALPPADGAETAALVVTGHLASPPRSESAMAAAVPFRGLPAWRLYLGLPLLGSRLPEGGLDEFFRLFREDLVFNVFDPVTRRAVAELPAVLAELRDRLPIDDAPLGLVGGSMGAWVAQSVLAETEAPVSAVPLVSPAIRLTSVVARYERLWDSGYPCRRLAKRRVRGHGGLQLASRARRPDRVPGVRAVRRPRPSLGCAARGTGEQWLARGHGAFNAVRHEEVP